MHRNRALYWLGFLTVCAALAGCHPRRTFAPTFPVHGSVKLDTRPLAEGAIAFISPETGDLQELSVKDGKYEGQVRAGNRRVEIRAFRPRSGPPKPMDPPPKNFLPKRYNSDTTLSANVSAAGPNMFDFDLSSR